MKTKFLIILIVFSAGNIFAQTDSLKIQRSIEALNKKTVSIEGDIESLKKTTNNQVTNEEFGNLKKEFEDSKDQAKTIIDSLNRNVLHKHKLFKEQQSNLEKKYKKLNGNFESYKKNVKRKIDSLGKYAETKIDSIQKKAGKLDSKINETDKNASDLNETVSQNRLYWIIAILAAAVLSLLLFYLFYKQKKNSYKKLQDIIKSVDEKIVKSYNELLIVIEKLLKELKKEVNHKFYLKVADEITRIQNNLARMDEKTKGRKQLIASVKRIQDNFASNDYEIVEMLGKKYNEGMKVEAEFIDDDSLEESQQIITRIIRPQVNYKGVMIQSAKIVVSQGIRIS